MNRARIILNMATYTQVERSDSGSSSSDSDTNSSRSITSSSLLNAVFSADDSVKDPNFQPYNERSSDSESDVQSKLITEKFCISPQQALLA